MSNAPKMASQWIIIGQFFGCGMMAQRLFELKGRGVTGAMIALSLVAACVISYFIFIARSQTP